MRNSNASYIIMLTIQRYIQPAAFAA